MEQLFSFETNKLQSCFSYKGETINRIDEYKFNTAFYAKQNYFNVVEISIDLITSI